MSALDIDRDLHGMLRDRQRLLRQLARVLRRVGPNHPQRHQVNHARSVDRKQLKDALRKNADTIAAHCLITYLPPPA
jgi:uncharacterized protein involved in exopolysaccharide biosynthesis